jgi:hypothetical protein
MKSDMTGAYGTYKREQKCDQCFFRKPEEQRSRSRWEGTIKTEGVTEFM